MLSARPRYQQVVLLGCALAVLVLLYSRYRDTAGIPGIASSFDPPAKHTFPSDHSASGDYSPVTAADSPFDADHDCPDILGASDILVALKTGATEARRRLPAHFDTYLRCIPQYVIYSDLAEDIDGHKVYDALDNISEDMRLHSPDFELYRQLQDYQREGKDFDSLREAASGKKEETRAWKLDKWKFLPMVEKAVAHQPTANWYIFIEADTFLVWSNMLKYLSKLDSSKPIYLGGQNWMGDTEFANGGSGYILSNSAAHMFTKQIDSNRQKYEKAVDEDCCGDLMIAKVLRDIDIRITRAFPIVQGETPSTLDYTGLHWCHPVVTYHHMSADEIADYWKFEQQWLRGPNAQAPIMHRDVFEHFVEPHIQHASPKWDNISKDRIFTSASDPNASAEQKVAHKSSQACSLACHQDTRCMQYQFRPGQCKFGDVIRLGQSVPEDVESGWEWERIKDFKKQQEPCEPQWILS
ncbi:hypothetical protein FH972_025174 [Carpinus fangiana]|uniref:Glycosyltransferase family 31 protein n=1 Tax=Carpinus fangiana TaxID=176857 RepID=A0A5N6L172_9ROSI|nr:hypothetical protein FH972_025174 [Carpinus fangiana]